MDLAQCPSLNKERQRSPLHSEVSSPLFGHLSPWLAVFQIISVTDIPGRAPNPMSTAATQARRSRKGVGVQFKACLGRPSGSPKAQLSQSYSAPTCKPASPTPLSQAGLSIPTYLPDFSAYPPNLALRPKPKERPLLQGIVRAVESPKRGSWLPKEQIESKSPGFSPRPWACLSCLPNPLKSELTKSLSAWAWIAETGLQIHALASLTASPSSFWVMAQDPPDPTPIRCWLSG